MTTAEGETVTGFRRITDAAFLISPGWRWAESIQHLFPLKSVKEKYI